MNSLVRRVSPIQCRMIGVRFKDLKITNTSLPKKLDRTYIISPNVKYIEYDDTERKMSIIYNNNTFEELYDDKNMVSIKHTYYDIVDYIDTIEHQDIEEFCKDKI